MKEYAVKVYDDRTEWFYDNKRHRDNGPAVERASGNKVWYINGKRHRDDGPAVEYTNGHKEWYINGKLHRDNGPAIEYASGTKAWYINGELLTEQQFNQFLVQKNANCASKTVEIDGVKYKLTPI